MPPDQMPGAAGNMPTADVIDQNNPNSNQNPGPPPAGQQHGPQGGEQSQSGQADGSEGGEGNNAPAPAPKPEKVYTQAELNRIAAKAEAKGERRAARLLREHQQPQQQGNQQQGRDEDRAPARNQFQNDEDWLDARDNWRDQKRERETRQTQARTEQASLLERSNGHYKVAAKLGGFDQEAFDAIDFSSTVARAMIDSDIGPQLMAFFSQNPDRADDLADLTPAQQLKALGRIEGEVEAASKNAPRASNAPNPPARVGTGGQSRDVPGDLTRVQTQAEYEAARVRQKAPWARRPG